MKTLTMPVIGCYDTESIRSSIPSSFRATTRNPAFKLMLRLFTVFGLMMMFAISGWGVNGCTGTTNVNLTSASNQYISSGTSTDGTGQKYYFTVSGPGTVSISTTTNNSMVLNANATACPINSGGTSSQSLTLNSSDLDFNVLVYRSSGSSSKSYTLTVIFTPYTPPIMGNVQNQNATIGVAFSLNPALSSYVTLTDGDPILSYAYTGTLPPGVAFNTSTGVFSGTPTTAGTYNLSVTATDKDGASNADSFSITVTAPTANLALTNTDNPDPVITNASLVYTLGVSNAGPQAATSLTLTDTLPAGVTYQSASGTGWSCFQAGSVVTCTNPSLANGASSSVAITVTAPSSAGMITNTATVTSAVADPTPANNTNIAQSTTVITPNADLSLVKTAPTSVMVGNQIIYTINITNNGSSGTDLNMTDVLNANLTYINAYDDAHEWICTYTSANRTVSCQHPNILANGATSTITILATAPSTVMSISNSASVIGTLPDPNMGNNTGSATVSVTASSFANSNPRNFTLQKQYNINGDVKIIGNTIMQDASTHTCAAPGVNNNGITVEYVDIDTNASTFNSTSANITLPTGITSNDIEWAGLYWQGYYDNNNASAATKTNAKNVLLKIPGSSNYSSIQSDSAKFNWVYFDDAKGRWYYQGGQDVTSYVKSGLSGTYTVANIYSQIGGGINGGGFGAWALMVVYKDNNATLKNMSVYDGYVGISSSDAGRTGVYASTAIPLSGFFTPTSGNVNSEFLTFVGEGDVGLTGDFGSLSNSTGDIKLKNSLNPNDNLFNATISNNGVPVTTRNPQCPNNIGIDIDSFDVGSTATTPTTQGQIIQNGQTTTNVKLSSSGDGYFPGAFAFSTDLYVPDVCYLEDVSYNGAPISTTNLPHQDDTVTYEVSITNKDNEAAKGVFIEKVFNKPNEITYVPNSMLIAPIPGTTYTAKTDSIGDDTAEYLSVTNTAKLLLGSGASWYEGGTIIKDAITKFKYQAKIGDQNASENTYLVSYRNDLLHITFSGLPIRKCQDFNNSFGVYVPVIGKFNTVRSGAVAVASGDTDPIDPLDNKNALYTQIVNKSFDVDVISFASDNITPTAPSSAVDLNLSIVELSTDGNCTDSNLSAIQTLHFTTSDKYRTTTVIPNKASQNAAFHMVTSTANLCSRDRFAIRPATYTMDANNTTLIGGRNYSFTFTATKDSSISPSLHYDQNMTGAADKNGTTQLVIPAGCAIVDAGPKLFNDPNPYNLSFSDGQVVGLVMYPNIGDVNFTVTDNQWTQASNDQSKGDCVVGSASNVVNGNGQFGCMVRGSKVFTFVPARFDNNITTNTLQNYNGGQFTYLSSDQNMSTRLTLTLKALLDSGAVATNYTQKCFARDVNTTVNLIDHPIPDLTTVNGKTGALNRIMMFGNNATAQLLTLTPPHAVLKTSEGNFTNGSALVYIDLNFDRNPTITENPFNITLSDFNASFVDTSGTSGSDFNRNNDMNATFVYGRIIPRDVRVFGATTSFNANGWYEAYNTSSLGGIGLSPSRFDSMWYSNRLHVDPTDGDANVTVVITGANPTNTTAVGGVETYSFTGGLALGGYKAHILTAPWLWYGVNASPYLDPNGPAQAGADNLDCLTHPCFNINIVPPAGATGSAKSTNEGTKGSKKTNTGGGAWHSTSDYAPAIR